MMYKMKRNGMMRRKIFRRARSATAASATIEDGSDTAWSDMDNSFSSIGLLKTPLLALPTPPYQSGQGPEHGQTTADIEGLAGNSRRTVAGQQNSHGYDFFRLEPAPNRGDS